MNRFISVLLFVILASGISMYMSCAKETSKDEGFRIALVTDTGGIDDKSFNQGTWEGVIRFVEEFEGESTYLQSESDADYIPNLSTVSDEGYDLVVAPGFLFIDSVAEVSANYPDTKYLIIDSVVEERNNVVSAVFSEEEGSFLVGIAAALQAQSDNVQKVGFIGGMEFDVIHRFEAGFEAGVKAVDPEIEVAIDYAGDFANPQIGQTIASKMYDSGITVIFHAAGATGNGLIKEARDRRIQQEGARGGLPVWAIGVDKNQYEDGVYDDKGNSVMLTSMLKRVDIASYTVAKMTLQGNFPGGQVFKFSLKDDGVGIPADNPNIKPEFMVTINEWKEKIVNGEYTVPTNPTRLQ